MKQSVVAALLLLLPLSVGAVEKPEVAQVNADVRVEVNGKSEERQGVTASTSAKGQATAEAHRSSVATYVQSLLSAADRDGGIGADVRAVAQSQQESASSTAEAMAKVESRSKVMDFLFGTDWKNIGAIRSAAARTAADIERLETAMEKTSSTSVRTELEAQIALLAEQQTELEEFVATHESSFSLFGWFTKLFVQAEA